MSFADSVPGFGEVFRSLGQWGARGTNDKGAMSGEWPETFEQWRAWYSWLETAYKGLPYTLKDHTDLRLFRALDPDGEIIAETRRLSRDVQHVVETDARALAGALWTLERQDGDQSDSDATLMAGEAVWKRSHLQRHKGRWAMTGAMMGDIGIEVQRTNATRPYDTKLVAYDPRLFWCDYDRQTNTELERVVIVSSYFDPPEVGTYGQVTPSGRMMPYVRILDREEIRVYLDGKLVPKESGRHKLGVVPFIHLPFIPLLSDPGHGVWAAVGLEQVQAVMDSMLTQLHAIGTRFANPFWAAIGARLNADADVFKFGRVLNIPQGAEFKAIEADLAGVQNLLATIETAREEVRSTLPEFLFTKAGANASGAAMNFWATAFVSKVEEIRGRWYPAIAEATEMAVAMDAQREWDPEEGLFQISAPPVLPVNLTEMLDNLQKAKDGYGLMQKDYIGKLQTYGIVPPDVDPEEYADMVKEEAGGRADRENQALLDAARLLQGGQPPAPPEPAPGEEPEETE